MRSFNPTLSTVQPPSGGFHVVARRFIGGRASAAHRSRIGAPALPTLLAFAAVLLLLSACVSATPAPATTPPLAVVRAAGAASADPGNYCIACHSAGDDRPAHALDWAGGIEREALSPCPAAVQARQEVYTTERLLLAIDRARAAVPRSAARDKADTQIAAARQGYSRLLDTPLTSLDAFTAEAQSLRYRLGKLYANLNQLDAAAKRDRVLLAAGLLTLALLISLAWGWRNTLRITNQRIGESRNTQHATRNTFNPHSLIPDLLSSWRVLVLAALTLAFFSLPLFRIPAAEVVTPTAEEQARQTALDTATRTADVADRGLARAWMLGRVGAALAAGDKQAGESALSEALAADAAIRTDAAALWGQGQAVQEAAVGSLVAQEEALLIADRLSAVQNRAWALRLIAEEWAGIDKTKAEQFLSQAQVLLRPAQVPIYQSTNYQSTSPQSPIPNPYAALDLRALAVAWARLDKAKGLELAAQVADPALRAWAYRDIAVGAGDAALFRQAAEAARAVPDPIRRSQALAQSAARSGDKGVWDEALAALADVKDPARSYAHADLALAGYPGGLEQIGAAFPAERSLAQLALRNYPEAAAEAGRIADPVERSHALAAVAVASDDADLARKITDPTLRDRVLRNIAVARKDAVLARSIAGPYERVQAVAAIAPAQVSADDIAALRETFPLAGLAVALARSDPAAALALVEKLDRPADKAAALRAVAAATGDSAASDRALGMALAARVCGDALAPAEASLALARQVKDKAAVGRALAQALDVAQKIAVKYK